MPSSMPDDFVVTREGIAVPERAWADDDRDGWAEEARLQALLSWPDCPWWPGKCVKLKGRCLYCGGSV